MKRILTLLFMINASFLYGQTACDEMLYLSFDDTSCISHLTIDTTEFLHNIWQIGNYHKSVIDSSACSTKVIITDTVNPYPINDTSVFIIKSMVTPGVFYDVRTFSGRYYVQSDSLRDFGKMEFSPDMGVTWIDMLNDTSYSSIFIWYSKPVLTGHSHTCKYFDVLLGDLGSVFNLEFGDTLIYRFTFISDSIYDNLGGLMYDNLSFWDFIEGISEVRFKPIKSSIYPNPSTAVFTIEYENPDNEPFELHIYDIHSKLVYTKDGITENRIVVDAQQFQPGTYIYKLTNMKVPKRCWGKFITTK
jgi:hypothetical protein